MIGQTVGNYRLLKVLGEGGMGVVYEAEHVAMGRRAAVKMLPADRVRDQTMIRRFLNEARATNEVRHPGIVQIYDCGTAADGSPWLIMELLEGETLGARMTRLGRFPAADTVLFGAQAASVLAAAHAAGIVHRDLKPENLFVVPDPNVSNGTRVKVLDFGIAKLAARDPGSALRTQTGLLIGTPLYMSPEQCRGTKQVDFRSDIYSLGLIVYQMIAGVPPFVSEGIGELMHMHMNEAPAPLAQHNPSVGAALAATVGKALEKDPAARHASMTAFQEELVASLAGEEPSTTRRRAAPVAAPGQTLPIITGAITGSTTLSTNAGELRRRSDDGPVDVPRRGRGGMVAALVVVLGAGGFFALRASRSGGGEAGSGRDPLTATAPAPAAPMVEPSPAPEPAAPAVTPARTSVDIATTPAAARLIDANDGRLLGTSPWHGELTTGTGEAKIRIEKAGYKPRAISIPLAHPFKGTFELERARASGHHGGDSSGEHIIKL